MEVETAQRGDEAPKPQPFSREALERELNAAQVEAVMYPPGPLLVVAGAGSGKTRVITYRLARLVATGADPRRILAVTFTNKAAGEMRERVDKLLWDGWGSARAGCGSGPFTRPAARLLRQWGEAVGLRKDFVIYDDDDQKRLLGAGADRPQGARAAVPGAPGAVGDRSRQEPGASAGRLRRRRLLRRRRRQGLPAVRGAAGGGERDRLRRPAAVGAAAVRQRDARGRGDRRSASITCWSTSSRTPTASSTGWCACCRGARDSITVVGDDDQSIYRWRGADIRNILDFERDHPGRAGRQARAQLPLDRATSWRAANAVIEKNSERRPKRLFTEAGRGRAIVLFEGETERDEAEFVAARIDDALSATLAPRDFAVFYRTNAQSRVLEEALRARNLPYTVVGGTRFFDRAEIKDLLAYLRAVANPDDGIALQRIINIPARGIGDATVDRIGDIIYERKIPAWQALELVAPTTRSCWARGRARRSRRSSR